MIGIIGAMDVEIEALKALLTDRRDTLLGTNTFSVGRLFGAEAVLAVCGCGKVNAALCTQQMILTWHPAWVLNIGVAGAADPALRIGDIVVASAAVQHDMDTTPMGDPIGYVSKIGLVEFPCDPALLARLKEAAGAIPDVRVVEGVVATGDQFVNQPARTAWIRETFHAAAVEMEGAAVAHACLLHDVPCGVLRSISDGANDDSGMDFAAFTRMAAGHAQRVVEHLLTGREGEEA